MLPIGNADEGKTSKYSSKSHTQPPSTALFSLSRMDVVTNVRPACNAFVKKNDERKYHVTH